MLHWLRNLKSIWYEDILRRNKITPFIIFLSFIISFGTARVVVHVFPTLNIIIKQYHIHHFYYGFILLIISNWIALVTNKKIMFWISAAIFGAGLGAIVDEFGLLLTCATPALQCDYWARQSFDAFIIIIVLLLAILYSRPFLKMVGMPPKFIFDLIKNKRGRKR